MAGIRWWLFDRYERAHLTEVRADSMPANALCGLPIAKDGAWPLGADVPGARRCVTCQREANLRVRAVGLHAR